MAFLFLKKINGFSQHTSYPYRYPRGTLGMRQGVVFCREHQSEDTYINIGILAEIWGKVGLMYSSANQSEDTYINIGILAEIWGEVGLMYSSAIRARIPILI